MTLFLLQTALPSAFAADAQVGGAVDLVAGVTVGEAGTVGSFGLRQVEGDIQVGGRDFNFVTQLDLAATVSGDGIFLYSIAPERLVVAGGGKGWNLQGGIFPAFFRVESVDPWRNSFVLPSMASARTPYTILGGGAEFGGPSAWVNLLVGFQPSTVDVFKLDDGPVSLPFIAGLRGRFDLGNAHLGGGAWFGGNFASLGFGGLELGGNVELGVVSPYGEFVSDLRDGHSGFLGADLFPSSVVSPGARVELDAQRGFGVGVDVASTLFDILRIKAEASYQAGNPGVYLEVAVYSKAPVDDDRYGRPLTAHPQSTPAKVEKKKK